MNRTILILILVIVGQLKTFATLQESDILIWNNDTLILDKSPLESLPEVCKKIRDKEKTEISSCWNGFIAEWILIDDILYLQNIYSYSTRKKINKRVEKILNRKFENGKLEANWFSNKLYGGFGRYLHCFYYLVYEKERRFQFSNGKLKKVENFDAKNIEYSINEKAVEEFVYKNFNWKIFESNKEFRTSASVYIQADNSGKIKTIKFDSSAGYQIDKEIERVLKLIPNWGIYYWHGEAYSFFNNYDLEFNNEKMKKYTR